MPVEVDIRINARSIAHLTITRIEGLPVADSINTYRARYNSLENEPREATVVHRYGDSVDMLLRKALDALHPVGRARMRCGAPIVDPRGQYRACRKLVAHAGYCHLHREQERHG